MAAVEQHHAAPASARLYDRHYGRVLSYCLWQLGKREDAEDAAQSTFLNAHNALRRGAAPKSEGAWLVAIAANVCRARWRSQRTRPAEIAREPDDFAGLAAPEDDRDLLGALRTALERLPEQQRRAFALREWRGLSYAEIAEQLGTTEAAVASLVFRARETLTQRLRDERPSRTSLGANLGSIAAWAKTLASGTAAKVAVAGAVAGVATVSVAVPLERADHSRAAVPARPAATPHVASVAPSRRSSRRRRVEPHQAAVRKQIPHRRATVPVRSRAVSPPTTVTPSPAAPPATPPAVGPMPTTDAGESPAAGPTPMPPSPPAIAPPAAPPAPVSDLAAQVGSAVSQVEGTVTQVISQLPVGPAPIKLGP
jgi:RNA polymerase sigma factor CnrH